MRELGRIIFLLVVALALAGPAAAPAAASIEWCEGDPPVHVWIDGKQYLVHAVEAIPKEFRQHRAPPVIVYAVDSNDGQHARVTVTLTSQTNLAGATYDSFFSLNMKSQGLSTTPVLAGVVAGKGTPVSIQITLELR